MYHTLRNMENKTLKNPRKLLTLMLIMTLLGFTNYFE